MSNMVHTPIRYGNVPKDKGAGYLSPGNGQEYAMLALIGLEKNPKFTKVDSLS